MDAAEATHITAARGHVQAVRAETANGKHRDRLRQVETILSRLLGEVPTFGPSHAARQAAQPVVVPPRDPDDELRVGDRIHNLGE